MHHRHAARPGVNGDVCGLQHVNRDLIPVGDDIRVGRGGAHRHEYSDRCDSNAPHGRLLARVLIDFVWTINARMRFGPKSAFLVRSATPHTSRSRGILGHAGSGAPPVLKTPKRRILGQPLGVVGVLVPGQAAVVGLNERRTGPASASPIGWCPPRQREAPEGRVSGGR